MPRTLNTLTAAAVKAAKFDGKPHKLFDGGGLFLHIMESGRYWRLKYRHRGKEKLLAIGVYPYVSLQTARVRRDEARTLLAENRDPVEVRQAEKAQELAEAVTLESVAVDWLASNEWTEITRLRIEARLRRHIFPILGKRPLTEITAPDLLETLRKIEKNGTIETARRAKEHVARVYRYAIAGGLATVNPAEGLQEAMKARPRPRHFAAIIDPKALGGLLRAMQGYDGTPIVRAALMLTPLLLVRPGELRRMEWAEVDLEAGLWTLPGEKMKMRAPHLVPLPAQAVAILKELEPWTGASRYVFPSERTNTRPLSENTVNAALRRLGYTKDEVTAHGFRATARTLMDETLGFRPDWIEHQLAHAVRDANGRAYNRTSFINERRGMMQAWADYLDGLRKGKEQVIPLRRSA